MTAWNKLIIEYDNTEYNDVEALLQDLTLNGIIKLKLKD